MKERNHQTLSDALARLPQHQAPESVWDTLEAALETDALLTRTLPQLPVHTPPALVWDQLETALEQDARPQSAKRFRLLPLHYAAAAALALLVAAVWFLLPTLPGTALAKVEVHQELLDSEIAAANAEPEDEAFALIDQMCEERVPVCEEPEFKNLRAELDELTSAKAELREALGNYGDDPELHAQLVRIERERSELLQQIMNLI